MEIYPFQSTSFKISLDLFLQVRSSCTLQVSHWQLKTSAGKVTVLIKQRLFGHY